MSAPVFVLQSVMESEDGGNDWWLDGVFANPDLAMAYVPGQLDENATGQWRLQTCHGGRRWVSVLPKRHRRGPGWTRAWVVDETEIIE